MAYENIALQQTRKLNGFSSTYTPPPNNIVYNRALRGNFDVNLQVALNEEIYTNGLTSEQSEALKEAIQNNDASNPTAQKIIKESSKKTLEDNDIQQGTWHPSSSDLVDSFTRVSSSTPKKAFVNVNEMMNSAQEKIVLLMPNGSDKESTLSLMKAISAALQKDQTATYKVEEGLAKTARGGAISKMEQQLTELKQIQELQEIESLLAKLQSMNHPMEYRHAIMKAFNIIRSLAAEGIISALFTALSSHYNWCSALNTAVCNHASDIASSLDPGASQSDLNALKAFIEVITITFSVPGNIVLIPSTVYTTLQNMIKADIVSVWLKACGHDSKNAPGFNLAVQFALLASMIAGCAFNPALAGAAGTGGGEKIAQQSVNAAQGTGEQVTTGMNNVLTNIPEKESGEMDAIRKGCLNNGCGYYFICEQYSNDYDHIIGQ